VFLATSDIHMEKKLHMSRQQVLDKIAEMVAYAHKLCGNVDFSPEDAVRSDFSFLCQAVKTAIEAGALTINIPDTVGYGVPFEFGGMIKRLINEVPGGDKVVFSAHCHNDLGLAVANSLAAASNGARQVECTINGIGERAGNASLEEIVNKGKRKQDRVKVDLKVEEETKPDLSAKLVAERIVDQLIKRYPHRRAVNQALEKVMQAGAEGVKISLSGRIGGAEIGRTEKYAEGKVPTQTLRANIDYYQVPARTRSGYVGIKVWIYKGMLVA
jgi:isopropylmalate/homocitrate/citramalate synthase